MTTLRLILLLSFLYLTMEGSAQVFIPDQVERDWLNTEIPGIVDGNGVMDTLHPGIALLDTATCIFDQGLASLTLHGIGHLEALVCLRVFTSGVPAETVPLGLSIVALPEGLRTLIMDVHNSDDPVALYLPSFPIDMDQLHISAHAYPGTDLLIDNLPQTVGIFEINGITGFSWNGECTANYLVIIAGGGTIYEPLSSVVIPPIIANDLRFSYGNVLSIDLQYISTEQIQLEGSPLSYTESIIWPNSIETINMFGCYWSGSPDGFPETIHSLSMSQCVTYCLPVLPDGLSILDISGPQQPCLSNWPSALEYAPIGGQVYTSTDAPYCSVLNSDCPGANPGIAGRVFRDLNENGSFDVGEPGLPQATVTLQPNGNMVSCASDGTWEIGVAPGNYTVTAASNYPYTQSIAPASHTADVPNMGDTDTDNDFAVTLTPDIQDLRAFVHADPARPGFDNQVYLRCENYGTTEVDAALTFTFDADQTWLGSSVSPASQSGNTATWTFPGMPIGSVQHIVVTLNTAASVVLGTDIAHTLIADPMTADETPADNTTHVTDSVVGSFDPNDKLLTPAVLSPTQVALGETPIEYTIRFQNTGTYLAERVVILDTLSEDLQWESMRFVASSHANHWYITDGVLHVIHNDIMLPDSNANEAASHGFFTFSLLPKSDLQDGASITNIAHIVFDFNAPIVTPPAVFTVDVEAGIGSVEADGGMMIMPNPATDRIQVVTNEPALFRYRIIDLLGHEVQSGMAQPSAWIDVNGLAKGPYVLELTQAGVRKGLRFMKR